MSADVRPLVDQIARTRAELTDVLADPGLPSDRARYAAVSKRWADLAEAFELAARWEDADQRARPRRRPCWPRATTTRCGRSSPTPAPSSTSWRRASARR